MAAIVMIHNQLRKKRSQQTQRLHLPIQRMHPFSYLHPKCCTTPVLFLWQTGNNTWQPHQLSAKKKGVELTCFSTYRSRATRHSDLANYIDGEGIAFTFQCTQIALILTYSYPKLWPEPSMVYKALDAQSHCFKSIVCAREFIGRKYIWQE